MDYYEFLRDAGLAALLLHVVASRKFQIRASAGLLYPSIAWFLSFIPMQHQMSSWEIAVYGLALAAFVLGVCELTDRRARSNTKKNTKDEQ